MSLNLINRLTNAAGWCKSQFMYYLVYTPQEKALIDRVEQARKSGQLKQFNQVEEYSDRYWQVRNELGKASEPDENKD
jgi:hypothetical protein